MCWFQEPKIKHELCRNSALLGLNAGQFINLYFGYPISLWAPDKSAKNRPMKTWQSVRMARTNGTKIHRIAHKISCWTPIPRLNRNRGHAITTVLEPSFYSSFRGRPGGKCLHLEHQKKKVPHFDTTMISGYAILGHLANYYFPASKKSRIFHSDAADSWNAKTNKGTAPAFTTCDR